MGIIEHKFHRLFFSKNKKKWNKFVEHMGKKLNYWAKHQKQVSIKTLFVNFVLSSGLFYRNNRDQSKEWVKNSKLKQHELEQKIKQKKREQQEEIETKQVVPIKTKKPEITSQMFFSYNTALGPPYRVCISPFCIILLSKLSH